MKRNPRTVSGYTEMKRVHRDGDDIPRNPFPFLHLGYLGLMTRLPSSVCLHTSGDLSVFQSITRVDSLPFVPTLTRRRQIEEGKESCAK